MKNQKILIAAVLCLAAVLVSVPYSSVSVRAREVSATEIAAIADPTEIQENTEGVEGVAVLNKQATVPELIEKKLNAAVESEALYTPDDFRSAGVIRYNDLRFTYYSEKVLPGNGLEIPGRHVDEGGYVCDENNFICVASCNYPKGSAIETPFGKQGKVYDVCPISGTVDVYVSW